MTGFLNFCAENLPIIICFLAGVGFLIVEAFMPGFGAPGITGCVLEVIALVLMWFGHGPLATLGLLLVVPFGAVVVTALGDYALTLVAALKDFSFPETFALNTKQISMLVAGAVLLLCPVLPLKSMLPAVYLRMVQEKNDAAA